MLTLASQVEVPTGGTLPEPFGPLPIKSVRLICAPDTGQVYKSQALVWLAQRDHVADHGQGDRAELSKACYRMSPGASNRGSLS